MSQYRKKATKSTAPTILSLPAGGRPPCHAAVNRNAFAVRYEKGPTTISRQAVRGGCGDYPAVCQRQAVLGHQQQQGGGASQRQQPAGRRPL
eukprot:COSAG01_NODE_523_length_15948_cov_161.993690_18_plen_92_part_00